MSTYSNLHYLNCDAPIFFEILHSLQRMSGTETETKIMNKKLMRMFAKSEESIRHKQACKFLDGVHYFQNGKVLSDYTNGFIMLDPWESDLVPEEPVKEPIVEPVVVEEKTKPISYLYLKHINPIWYIQVSMYAKSPIRLGGYGKVRYQKALSDLQLFDSLDEMSKGLIPDKGREIKLTLQEEVRKLQTSFKIDFFNFTNYSHRSQEWCKNTDFFFLNPKEVEAIYNAFEIDKPISLKSYSMNHHVPTVSNLVRDIVKNPDKDRVYMTLPNTSLRLINKVKDFRYCSFSGKTYDYDELRNMERDKKITDFTLSEFMNKAMQLDDEFIPILNKLGIAYEKPKEEKKEEQLV